MRGKRKQGERSGAESERAGACDFKKREIERKEGKAEKNEA
jgi:hypothetical protein